MADDGGPRRRGPAIRVTYQGRTQSLVRWAQELGMNYSTLYHRVCIYRWPLALAFLPRNRPGRRAYGGEYKSYRQWAREVGLNEQTLASRLRRGWPLADAIETPPMATGHKRKRR